MKVLTVVGNRPQFIKAAAVSRHLRAGGEEVLVDTGQHYDRELSQVFFEELELPSAEHQLGVGSGTHAEQTAAILTALEPLALTLEPDAMLVYGDTNSTLGAALIAAKLQIPLAHVEAGMRSFDREMPEEVNRVVVDRLSGLLLCSTPAAVDNLRSEGITDGVELVGDVMADVSMLFGPVAERRSAVLEKLELEPKAYFVATAHRAGNVDYPENLRRLVSVLAEAAKRAPVIFAIHPRTRARLRVAGLLAEVESAGVRPIDPLGYLDFTKLVRNSRAVLTDSGGLQKEAYLAGVPCVTLRDATEWVETVSSGWNTLIGLDPAAAGRALDELLEGRGRDAHDPELYGSGHAGERVASAIVAWQA